MLNHSDSNLLNYNLKTDDNSKSLNKNDNLLLKKKINYLNNDIKHLQQATKNDCGIACFKMALK